MRRVNGTSRRQSGVLPHRVSGGGDGLDAPAAEQDREGDADEAQRGLGVLGEAQLVIAGRREEPAQVDRGRGRAPVAERGDLLVFEELGPHAGLLRALAGKQKRYVRRRAIPSPSGLRGRRTARSSGRLRAAGEDACSSGKAGSGRARARGASAADPSSTWTV